MRIIKDLDLDLSGRDVIVVEDIIDSGLTLNYLRRNLQARGPASLEVCALLLREGFWYVIGLEVDRGEVRTFRVDRIEDARVLIDDQEIGVDLFGQHRMRRGNREALREARLGVRREFARRRLVVEDVGLLPVHLEEPVRRHCGAHAIVVVQHDDGVARADILIRRLYELASRGVAEAL